MIKEHFHLKISTFSGERPKKNEVGVGVAVAVENLIERVTKMGICSGPYHSFNSGSTFEVKICLNKIEIKTQIRN